MMAPFWCDSSLMLPNVVSAMLDKPLTIRVPHYVVGGTRFKYFTKVFAAVSVIHGFISSVVVVSR